MMTPTEARNAHAQSFATKYPRDFSNAESVLPTVKAWNAEDAANGKEAHGPFVHLVLALEADDQTWARVLAVYGAEKLHRIAFLVANLVEGYHVPDVA